ncbi:MAG: methyltransferase domain-containing protein [Lentisphaerae bacterium]|nr:methyltransferase domain-containing protein [Lentisphaerota bacterium]
MDEKLYCFRLEDPSGEFEPATELLDALELQYSSFFDRENMTVIHTVYAESPSEAQTLLDSVVAMLPLWREMEVELIPGTIFELEKNEWANAWKKYFRPVEISPTLLVTPAWMEPEVKPEQTVLKIDTGMSFGTGQHPTTFYCLKKIDQFAPEISSMLDAGCGSGILAVAAALRGVEYVEGFDFDPDAVEMSRQNQQLNALAPDSIKWACGDAGNYPGIPEKYDLVCANILGHLLITFRFNIASWVKPEGKLVLAGILKSDFDKVSGSFAELGFAELERETIGEWTGGLFAWKKG